MKLLESYPQDIKLARKFKPCAPLAFRWIVIGAYVSILVTGLIWGGISVHASHVDLKKKERQAEINEVNRAIAQERSQNLQSQQAKIDYDAYQQWLRQTYSTTQMLNVMFAALPENARLREMKLTNSSGSRFDMVLDVFPVSDGSIISFENFISKLGGVGINLENTAQSVADGIELSCSFNLPSRFFPAQAPKGSPAPMIQSAPAIETPPMEGGEML